MLLRKQGGEVSPILPTQRSGYRVVTSTDVATGQAIAGVTVDDPAHDVLEE
jgi:hypothetical protein